MKDIDVDGRIVGPIIFIIFSILFLYFIISKTPKILILHSYNSEYIWTSIVDKSLRSELKKQQGRRVKFFYMNSKYVYNKATEVSAQKVVEQYDPDLIIAFDDNAQKFLSRYYLNSGIKIIFAGVNGGVEQYNYINNKNVTGIFERKPITGILFILRQLNYHHDKHHRKGLMLLVDSSNSSKKDAEFLKSKDWKEFKFTSEIAVTFDDWKKQILNIKKRDIDFLLLSGYRKLVVGKKDGVEQYADYKKVVKWTNKNTPVPIVALNIFAAKDGFPLAIGSSAYEQVHIALDMANKIFDKNTSPGSIPYRYPKFYSVSINKTSMLKSKYHIPSFLESFAGSSHNIYE